MKSPFIGCEHSCVRVSLLEKFKTKELDLLTPGLTHGTLRASAVSVSAFY
jgi:hypothetical protein